MSYEKARTVDVLIVGTGPTGLMLAGELALHGVDVLAIGRRLTPENESRALGFTSSTLELFAHRGMLEEFAPLETIPAVHFAGIVIDADQLSSGYAPVMRYPQYKTERVLLERANRLGAQVIVGESVDSVRKDGDRYVANTSSISAQAVSARYVIGCDGAHSSVRSAAGLDYALTPPSVQMLLADLESTDFPDNQFGRKTARGMVMSGPLEPGLSRVIVCEFDAPPLERGARLSEGQLRAAYEHVTGEPMPSATLRWASYFDDSSGMADCFASDGIFIAGDAAHTHLPAGGQGMNVSIQDAANLGWKLAAQINGWAPAELLSTYDSERRIAASQLLANTRAQGQVFLRGSQVDPLRDLIARLATQIPPVATALADEVSGLDIRYPIPGATSIATGRLLATKALDLKGFANPPVGLLSEGRGAFIASAAWSEHHSLIGRWANRVSLHHIATEDTTEYLVRPDGYVVWSTGDGLDQLLHTLTRWFGEPAAE